MNKSRHTIRLSDEIWDKVKSHYRADDCTTQNEFVEKALAFLSALWMPEGRKII